jgi:hypothetical protein
MQFPPKKHNISPLQRCNWLILFKEIIVLRGFTAGLLAVEAGGAYSYH